MSLAKLTRLNLLMLLFCFIHPADGQVTFQYKQMSQEIDLLCDVDNLNATNLTNLEGLVISRLDSGQWQILASLYYAHNEPVSHLQDAEVSGQISSTGSSSSFLHIHWRNAQPKLDGTYKCGAYDSVFMPASTEQELKIQVQKGEFFVVTKPDIISVGLSQTLDINCSVSDSNALNMSKLGSLSIFRIHEGVEQTLADIKSGHDVSLKPGVDSVFVQGFLDSNEGFINLRWSSPGVDQAGVYICEVSGINATGDPVFLSRRKTVTWEDPRCQELTRRLAEMNQTKIDLENLLVEMNQTKVDLNNSLNKCLFPKSCDDLTLPIGQHVVTLNPDNDGPLLVVCDVKSPNETWTILQKRFDGSVDFYRNFSEYENGFGSINGEHWLGLKHIKRLLDATGHNHEFRVDMVLASNGTRYTRIYPTFSIGQGDSYTLTVAGYDDGGLGMSYNNGAAFSTYDHGPRQIVAKQGAYSAGWWFKGGSYVNLNGAWGVDGEQSSIRWYEIGTNYSVSLSTTEMKFRS